MQPILAPSFARLIPKQILVIAKLNGRKDFILRGFFCDIIRPYKELPVQSQQLKHKNKVSRLFKIKSEDARAMSMASFQCYTVNCEHISNFLLITGFEQANLCWVSIEKTSTFGDKIWYIMHYVVAI